MDQKEKCNSLCETEVVLGNSLLKIVLPPPHFKKYTPSLVVPLEELHFLSKLFHLTRLPPVFAKNKCGPHVRGHLEDLHILTQFSVKSQSVSLEVEWSNDSLSNNMASQLEHNNQISFRLFLTIRTAR